MVKYLKQQNLPPLFIFIIVTCIFCSNRYNYYNSREKDDNQQQIAKVYKYINARLHNWLSSSFHAPFLLQTKDTDPDLIYPPWQVYPQVASTSRLQPDDSLPFSKEPWHLITEKISDVLSK